MMFAKLPRAGDVHEFVLEGIPVNETLARDLVAGGFLEQQRSGPRYPADPGVRCSTPIGRDTGRQEEVPIPIDRRLL